MSVSNRFYRMNNRLGWGALIIVLLTVLGSWIAIKKIDSHLRELLLVKSRIVAQAVQLESVKALSGTEADLNTSEYLELKDQLDKICKTDSDYRFIYLMGRLDDGKVFFFVDNEPVGSDDESPAGQIYEEIPDEYLQVFDSKTELIVGPVRDRWGTWVTAMIPLTDPSSGDMIAVLGMDVNARSWRMSVAVRAILPIGALLILLGAGVILFFSTQSVDASLKPVLKRLMPPLVTIVSFLIAGAYVVVSYQYEQHQEVTIANNLAEISGDLNSALRKEAHGLATALQPIVGNPQMKSALFSNDSGRLLKDWHQVFMAMHNDNAITHFYFLDKNRTCLLRVHKPEKHGDQINRYTALEAESTGEVSSGIELGPLGTFTLRVVQPVFQDEKLLGYVELGKEIENILQDLHTRSGIHLIATIHKDHLNQKTWEDGMLFLGKEADWSQLSGSAVIFSSVGRLPDALAQFADQDSAENHSPSETIRLSLNDREWSISTIPLKDVSGNHVGELIAMLDITNPEGEFKRLLIFGGATSILLAMLLLGYVYILLHRTDLAITLQQSNLRESESRHRAMFQKNQSIQFLIDPRDGTIVDANKSACTYYGYAHGDMLKMNISDINILSPEEVAREMEAARLEHRNRFASKHRKANGEIRDVDVYTGNIPANGRMYLYSIIHDVTERNQAEGALKNNQKRLTGVIKGTNAGTWEWNVQTGETTFNERWAQIIGYTLNEIQPISIKTWMKYAHPDDLEVSNGLLEKHFRNENDFYEFESRMRHKDGSWVWVLDRGQVISWTEDGKPQVMMGTHQDISDRKKAEETLKESEQRYKSIFDSIQDVYAEVDMDGTILEITESILEVSGYSRTEMLGTLLSDYYIDPEEQNALMSILREKGRVNDHEVLLRHKDGTTRVYSFTVRIIANGDGQELKVVGNMRDITDRKQMETALKTSEERLDLALKVANDGIWDWNLRDNSIFYDTRYYTMAGYEPNEFPSTFDEWEKRVHPDDLERTKTAISCYRSGDSDVYEEEFRFLHKNGNYIWLFAKGQTVEQAEDGTPLRIVGTHSDISRRKLSEQNTLQAKKRAEMILQLVQSGVIIIDAVTHEIVEANPAALEMSGYTHEEVVGHRCHSLLCSRQEGNCPITDLGEIVDNRETVLHTKDGGKKTIVKAVTEISLDERLYLLETFVDISDIKAIENDLVKSNLAKEKLFSIIAHDLRGPVGTQLGFLELVNEDYASFDSAEIKDIFGNLEVSTNKLYTLLNNLLSWSRLQSGGIKLERQLSNIAVLCEEVLSQCSVQSNAKNISISVIHQEDIVANIDASLMEIVLRNLLTNAIKFSQDGSSIDVIIDSDTNAYEIKIRDHGLGIPGDKIAEIFSPSNKYRQIGTAGEPTSGLGLPLAKEYTELNGGTIEVQSELGVGTTFIVRLPKPSDGA